MPKKEQRASIYESADLRRFKLRLWVYAAILIIILLLAACGGTSQRGNFADNQEILKSCDPTGPPASLVEIDGTGSSASEGITAERMTAIESIVQRTAVCSGTLRVIVFSASSAATTVLFDGSLVQDGATDNARLRHVPAAVTDTMNKIKQKYGPAIKALPQNGSDITAQYRLAAEWMLQVGDKYRLDLYVLTDGFQNVGVDLTTRPLSKQEAESLANQVSVPNLQGASVTVAGLGRVAGSPPPSAFVEGLINYYNALCTRTSAAKCLSVSDYATVGH